MDERWYTMDRPKSKYPKMSMSDRAAQFAPFAALTGHKEAVIEQGRITQEKRILSNEEKLEINEKIIELIEQYDIETQDELAELLRKEGFDVTQATVSRDIRKLALSKVPGKNGRQKYALLNHQDHQMAEKYVGILREAFVSMDQAQNILVIKTVSGMAMAVATALDNIGWKEIVGCIAGDDTIMCAIRTMEDAQTVMAELEKIVRR